jgi:hypothetical protein
MNFVKEIASFSNLSNYLNAWEKCARLRKPVGVHMQEYTSGVHVCGHMTGTHLTPVREYQSRSTRVWMREEKTSERINFAV